MPDIFWAPGRAAVPVPVKKVRRLKILALALALVLDVVHLATHPINNGEITVHVHVHDPMHVSDLIHVISCYVHIFMLIFCCI